MADHVDYNTIFSAIRAFKDVNRLWTEAVRTDECKMSKIKIIYLKSARFDEDEKPKAYITIIYLLFRPDVRDLRIISYSFPNVEYLNGPEDLHSTFYVQLAELMSEANKFTKLKKLSSNYSTKKLHVVESYLNCASAFVDTLTYFDYAKKKSVTLFQTIYGPFYRKPIDNN